MHMDLSATVLVGNNRITLSKVSAMKTLSKLEDAYFFIYNKQKNFN